MVLLSILAILGAFLFLHLRLRTHPELTFFATVCGFDVLAYLAALAGLLRPGAILLLVVGLAALIAAVARVATDSGSRRIARGAICPGVCIFVVGLILFWVKYHALPIHFNYDEFGHWAMVAKWVLSTHRLYTPGVPGWPDYPPAPCLFLYFICFLAPYREPYLNLAQAFLTLAPLVVLFMGVSWKQPLWIALRIAVALLGHCLYDQLYFPSLLVDDLMAIHFGMAVYAYLVLPADISRSRLLLFVPIVILLPLIKEMGFVFGFFFLFLVLVLTLRDRRRFLLAWGALLLAFTAGHMSWVAWKRAVHAGPSDNLAKMMPGNVIRALSGTATQEERTLRQEFYQVVLDTPPWWVPDGRRILPRLLRRVDRLRGRSFPQLAARGWQAVFATLLLLAIFWRRDQAARTVWIGVLMTVFLGAYLFVLLLVHLFPFRELGLSHVEPKYYARFLGSYLLAQFLVTWGLLLTSAATRKMGAWILCSVMLGGLYLYETPRFYFLQDVPQSPPERDAIDRHLRDLLALVPVDGQLALIHQGSQGEHSRILNYELLPRSGIIYPISIGKSAYAGDPITQDLSAEEWESLLLRCHITHVFVSQGDKTFWSRCGRLFAEGREQSDFLFQVEPQGDGHVVLRPIPGLFGGRIDPGAGCAVVRNQAQPHAVGEVRLRRATAEVSWSSGEEILHAAGSGGWAVGDHGDAFPREAGSPLLLDCDAPFVIRGGRVQVTLMNWADKSDTELRLDVSVDGQQFVPCGTCKLSWTETLGEVRLDALKDPGRRIWLRLFLDRSHPSLGVKSVSVRMSSVSREAPSGQGIRFSGSDPRETVVVSPGVFANDTTTLQLMQDGTFETSVLCDDAGTLLGTACEARGWKTGGMGIAFGPHDRSPLRLSLESPWPVDRVRAAIQLRNYADMHNIQFQIEASSEESKERFVRNCSVDSTTGSATLDFVLEPGTTRHVCLAVSVRRMCRELGIQGLDVFLHGRHSRAGWTLHDGALRLENLTDAPVIGEAFSGREE